MKIKKGQILAQLDPKDFKLKLDDRKAKFDLALAQANYNYTFLRAPFDGIVSKVLIDNHKNVQAQQTILHLQTINNIAAGCWL